MAEIEYDEARLRELIGELVGLADELATFRQRADDQRFRLVGASGRVGESVAP
jgi:hypothetical protein